MNQERYQIVTEMFYEKNNFAQRKQLIHHLVSDIRKQLEFVRFTLQCGNAQVISYGTG